MINIQRNFFIETILLETKFFKQKDIIDLPYKDYINISNNDDLNLIFIDIDRLDNLKKIYCSYMLGYIFFNFDKKIFL